MLVKYLEFLEEKNINIANDETWSKNDLEFINDGGEMTFNSRGGRGRIDITSFEIYLYMVKSRKLKALISVKKFL